MKQTLTNLIIVVVLFWTVALIVRGAVTVLDVPSSSTATSSVASLGVGTTSPQRVLSIQTTGTTTFYVESTSLTQGACLKLKNATGTAYTYMTVGYGTAIFSTIPCD